MTTVQMEQPPEPEYPYALDLLFVFVAVQTGPAAAFLVSAAIAFTIARRSSFAMSLVVDLVTQLTGRTALPVSPALYGLLPGLERVIERKHRTALPAASDAIPGDAVTPAPAFLSLEHLAASRNVLIVGSPGSGKTTLLRAVLARRGHPVFVFDPHAAPGDWPGAALVIGAGRDFAGIYKQLVNAEKRLDARSKQRASGERQTFPPLTLAGDEWGSICSEIVARDADAPGRILLRLLKEGRKFGINAVLSAHGDTVLSLGARGDSEAFKLSFDWIVYLGGFVRKHAGEQVRAFPHGRTPEGNTFPLIVAAVNPATNECRFVDLRGLSSVNHSQPSQATRPDGADLLAALLSQDAAVNAPGNELPDEVTKLPPVTNEVTACTSEVTNPDGVTKTLVTPAETALIVRLLITGNTPSQVAKRLPGYSPRRYKEFVRKVEVVQQMLDTPLPDHSGGICDV